MENNKPTPAQRLEALAEKIGADVHKLVDEFEAFVEKEIAKARGETVDNADADLKVAGTGTVTEKSDAVNEDPAKESSGNAEQNTGTDQPASDSTAAASDAEASTK